MITLKCLLWGQFESEGTDAKTTGKTADEKDWFIPVKVQKLRFLTMVVVWFSSFLHIQGNVLKNRENA